MQIPATHNADSSQSQCRFQPITMQIPANHNEDSSQSKTAISDVVTLVAQENTHDALSLSEIMDCACFHRM